MHLDRPSLLTQQQFLRATMSELNLSSETFAVRLGCAARTLEKWLLPHTDKDHKEMDEAAWSRVREIRRTVCTPTATPPQPPRNLSFTAR